MRRFPACDVPKDIGTWSAPQGTTREIREHFVNLSSVLPAQVGHQSREPSMVTVPGVDCTTIAP